MKKKEFKKLLANNPVFSEWVMENVELIKSKQEIMMYLMHHPDAMRHFQTSQAVDSEKIKRNAGQFASQLMQERMDRRKSKKRVEPANKTLPSGKKKGGLFSQLKMVFPNKENTAIPAQAARMPALRPPRIMQVPGAAAIPNSSKKTVRRPFIRLPKLNINREKVVETLTQTTEMFDVVSTLLSKLGSMK